MHQNQEYINIYSGTEIQVIMLRGLLENSNIRGIIQNNFHAGATAGFGGGSLSTVRLKINAEDLEKARPIVEQFIANQGN